MKRIDLQKHLRAHGCAFQRDGGDHARWVNLATGATASINRHREIPTATGKQVCKQLGVPPPPFK